MSEVREVIRCHQQPMMETFGKDLSNSKAAVSVATHSNALRSHSQGGGTEISMCYFLSAEASSNNIIFWREGVSK